MAYMYRYLSDEEWTYCDEDNYNYYKMHPLFLVRIVAD